MRFRNRRQSGSAFISGFRAQPVFRRLVHSIESGHFHMEIGSRRELAIHDLQVTQWRQKGCSTTRLLTPSSPGRKSQRSEKASQAVEDRCATGRTKKGNTLDHCLTLMADSIVRGSPAPHALVA